MEIKVTKSKKFIGFLSGFFLLATSSLSYGAVINVPTPAYPTIQDGIDAANNGDLVLVADGTFTGSGNRNLDFGGKEITVESSGGPENCIIDLEDTNNRGFYFHSGEDQNSVVSGFTIRGSLLTGDAEVTKGGGIFIAENSGPTITNCIIKENYSGYYGGGIYSAGPAIINNCSINDNYAWVGGGFDISGGTTVSNCDISNNGTEGGGIGGGLDISGYVKVINCIIDNNYVGDEGLGAGIAIGGDSDADIINCTISNNNGGDKGGGINIGSGSPNITGCNIFANYAHLGGGIYCRGNSIISKCIISNNSSSMDGGGVYIVDSSPIIENSIIYDNWSSDDGGGFYIFGNSIPVITNCTIADNSNAHSLTPGIDTYRDTPSSIILKNSILWGHEDEYQIAPYFDFILVTYNDIDQDGFEGVNGNIRQDPLFVDPDNGDFHLQKQSPCVNAGTSIGAADDDIDEDPRPLGAGYDIGADEFVFVKDKRNGGGGGGG